MVPIAALVPARPGTYDAAMICVPPRIPLSLSIAVVLLAASAPAPGQEPTGRAETEAFVERRLSSLTRDDGWLSLVGLFVLNRPQLTLGSDPESDLELPDRHPARVGTLLVGEDGVRFRAASDVEARVDDRAIDALRLESDTEGTPTVVEVGPLLFYVIERNDRPYLRVKDREAPLLRTFDGIERWDYDPAYRVEARWLPHAESHELFVPDVLGGGSGVECRGVLEFELQGTTLRLEPTGYGAERWSFIYGDATNGVASYGGGRFLYFDPPGPDGRTTLDFNQSYNPPCAFTPYSTCPLPPPDNVLDVAVLAGEKTWDGSH